MNNKVIAICLAAPIFFSGILVYGALYRGGWWLLLIPVCMVVYWEMVNTLLRFGFDGGWTAHEHMTDSVTDIMATVLEEMRKEG